MPSSYLTRNFRHLLDPSASAILLVLCTVGALVWANSQWSESYYSLWHFELGAMSLHAIINDGLMALFFFNVGLEIKRELTVGRLNSVRSATLPVLAAFGGMLVPAAIFLYFNRQGAGRPGWGIPMATDIAFALGVLALLGRRISPAVKVLLTAIAIIDDLGAVLVIAIFYTATLEWSSLAFGLAMLGISLAMNRLGLRRTLPYFMVGVLVWTFFLQSGIHATIAGVLLAFTIPATTGDRIEHMLSPVVALFIMPLFALSNAGVSLAGSDLTHPVAVGVALGLMVGKPVGIFALAWIGERVGLAALPSGVRYREVFGLACLGGIGFTMSLFIGGLAYADVELLQMAILGIFMASLASGMLGALVFMLIKPGSPSRIPTRH